jgi:hypothetical protein
MPEFLGSRFN